MASPNARNFLLLGRSYTIATENMRMQPTVVEIGKAKDQVKAEEMVGEQQKEKVPWMRDPKTGNWMPETHFNVMDVAELREKLLSKS